MAVISGLPNATINPKPSRNAEPTNEASFFIPKNIKMEKEHFFLSNVAQQGMSITRSTTLML